MAAKFEIFFSFYRVKQVNNGFATLRTHIPHLKNKTSKVDTLRAAVDYIRALRNLIGEGYLLQFCPIDGSKIIPVVS